MNIFIKIISVFRLESYSAGLATQQKNGLFAVLSLLAAADRVFLKASFYFFYRKLCIIMRYIV
jgi:hypothetical protein